MKTITVEIDEESSNVEVATTGFIGAACLKATDALERLLGSKSSDRKTSEYAKRSSHVLKQGR